MYLAVDIFLKMMILLIIAAVLVTAVIFLLTRPIILRINTDDNLYFFNVHSLGGANFYMKDNDIEILLNILYFKKKISLLESVSSRKKKVKKRVKKKKEDKKDKKDKSKKKKSLPAIFFYKVLFVGNEFLKDIVKSFEVKIFDITFDTGNYPLNAKLYGTVYFLKQMGINFEPNFTGKFYLNILILNYPYRLLKILLYRGIQALILFIKHK